MRREIWIICLLLLGLPLAAWAVEKSMIDVKPLSYHLNDTGCEFVPRNAKANAFPILISGPEGLVMHINGKDVSFKFKASQSDDRVHLYEADGIQLQLDYGPAKDYEAGSAFDRAAITLKYKGQTRKILAKGGCAC